MKNCFKKSCGFAQIPLMIVLLLMAVAIPVVTELVQDNADNRNLAKESNSCLSGNLGIACINDQGKTCQKFRDSNCNITCTANCKIGLNPLPTAVSASTGGGSASGNGGGGSASHTGGGIACHTGSGWRGSCSASEYCPEYLNGVKNEYDENGCEGWNFGCCGKQPFGSGTPCQTGAGWPGTCTTSSICNGALTMNVEFDDNGCAGDLGCCGKQPSGSGTTCHTDAGWPGTCQSFTECKAWFVSNKEYDENACDGFLVGCCAIQPASAISSSSPTVTLTNTIPTVIQTTRPTVIPTATPTTRPTGSPLNVGPIREFNTMVCCRIGNRGVAFETDELDCNQRGGSSISMHVCNSQTINIPAPTISSGGSSGGVPIAAVTQKPSSRNKGNKNDGNITNNGCIEQCPGSDQVLRNCTGITPSTIINSSGGTSDQTICSSSGLARTCGNSCFVCSAPNGEWQKQTDMSKCPALIPTVATGELLYLNYSIAYRGVSPDNSNCMYDWPLQFIVLGGDESKTYNGVIPETEKVVDNKLVLSGSLKLTGFTKSSNVTVFVKGNQTKQMKYCTNNQSAECKAAAVGSITLSNSATSPAYDFSNFPLMPGDVSGTTLGVQDGYVNALDYVYLRKNDHVTVDSNLFGKPESFLRGDLNGDCQINSQDITEYKITLEQIQDYI